VSRLPTTVLAAGAVGFAGFGAALLTVPSLLGVVDLAPPSATAASDLRAVYGGIELGVGVFLGVCAGRPAWRTPGLAAMTLALGGAAVGRLLGLTLDGAPRPIALVFGALELAGALAALLALLAMRRGPAAPG
jgi:hypothetical protein